MSTNFEAHYFEVTLPIFISKYFFSSATKSKNESVSLGNLESKLHNLSQQSLDRQRFVRILQRQIAKILENVEQKLKEEPHDFEYLKNCCKYRIYRWKLRDEIEESQKQPHFTKISEQTQLQNENKNIQSQEEYFSKIIWKLKIESQMAKPGTFELVISQIVTEISDSQHIPNKFKLRMKDWLQTNDIMPVSKYMKILGQQIQQSQILRKEELSGAVNSEKQMNPQESMKSQENFKSTQMTSEWKQTPSISQKMSNKSSFSSLIQPHKRIFKNKAASLGRTLFISHPIRHRAQREPKKKEIIQYVDQKQLNP